MPVYVVNVSNIQQLATRVHSDVTSVMSQALRVACYKGRHDVIKWLTSHTTADVSSAAVIRTTDGEMTSLMAACKMGHNGIAKLLLQCVTPHTVNMMSGRRRDTALHLTCFSETDSRLYTACREGDANTVSDLLYTSDVDLQDKSGSTSIHVACKNGHFEATRLLLSVFARTDITDDDRRTPAMVAQVYGFTMLKQYLRCTLTESRDNNRTSTRVTDNNTDTVSITLLSIEDAHTQQQQVTQVQSSHQSPHRTKKRIV
jgi:ankyrin repeat protein